MDEEGLRALEPGLDDRERRALAIAQDWIGDGVQGVAIGADEAGKSVVVVYANAPDCEAVRRLPSHVEGLAVRVEYGGTFTVGG
jgi:hypothetical protein